MQFNVTYSQCCMIASYLERHGERRLVDESPSRRVDEEGPGPHLLDRVLVDEVVVVLVEGAVQRHAVGLEEQVLKNKVIITNIIPIKLIFQ